MFVCCECCVLSCRGLCDKLITRPEESYRLVRCCVWSRHLKNEEAITRVGSQCHKKKKELVVCVCMFYYTILLHWSYTVSLSCSFIGIFVLLVGHWHCLCVCVCVCVSNFKQFHYFQVDIYQFLYIQNNTSWWWAVNLLTGNVFVKGPL
jgi:hypothetical protein